MCDLQQCEQLIATHEAQVGQPFDFVTRIRLDVAWEAELPVPAALFQPSAEDDDVVHVPHMNGQGGTNDKFVFGGRRAMAAYLNRTGYFWRNVSWYAWATRRAHSVGTPNAPSRQHHSPCMPPPWPPGAKPWGECSRTAPG